MTVDVFRHSSEGGMSSENHWHWPP